MANLYNSNLELTVLSCLFHDGSQWAVVEDILSKKSFKFPAHGFIFKAMEDVVNSDLYPDVVTVSAELDKKGILSNVVLENGMAGLEALRFIASMDVNVDNLESYALQVQQLQANRELKALSANIDQWVDSGNLPFDTLTRIDESTGRISAFIGSRSSDVKTARESAGNSLSDYEESRKGTKKYIETRLKAFDSFTNGLFQGRLYIIAARSGMGKSALIHNFIKNLSIDDNYKVHLFSLEMSASEVTNRLIQIMTGIQPLSLEKGELNDYEVPLYEEAILKISNATYTIDDSPILSLALLRTKARKAVSNGCQLLLVDQLENLSVGGSGDTQPEYLRLNFIAYRLKALARELNVPLVLVHQLNRGIDKTEGNKDTKRDPVLGDLAQSGERPADVVCMIRTDYDSALFFVKNRQSKKGKSEVDWIPNRITFKDKEEVFPDRLM